MFGSINNTRSDSSRGPEPGSGPTRQRSFKDRLRDGISHGLAWQNKSKSVDQASTAGGGRAPGGASPPHLLSGVNLSVVGSRCNAVLSGDQDSKELKMVSVTGGGIGGAGGGGQDAMETQHYVVQNNDTLNSIAAKFGLTPSELAKANRLSSRYVVFPGQSLKVPKHATPATTVTPSVEVARVSEPGGGEGDDASASNKDFTSSPTEKELTEMILRPLSPRPPGRTERLNSSISSAGGTSGSGSRQLSRDSDDLDRECLEKFLKINVRHITDGQGVVEGVLLVTPNAIMFDPNVSDPLVIENGAEAYGIIAPMDFVVNSAIYFDIAHMKVKDRSFESLKSSPKPQIYFGPGTVRRDEITSNGDSSGECTASVEGAKGKETAQAQGDAPVLTTAGSFEARVFDSPKKSSGSGDTFPSTPEPLKQHQLQYPTTPVQTTPAEKRSGSTCSSGSGSGSMLFSLNPRELLKSISGDDHHRGPDSPGRTPPSPSYTATAAGAATAAAGAAAGAATAAAGAATAAAAAAVAAAESKKQKVLKRLSNPLQWIDSFGSSGVDSQNSSHPNTPPTTSTSSPLHAQLQSSPHAGSGRDPGSGSASPSATVFSRMFSSVAKMPEELGRAVVDPLVAFSNAAVSVGTGGLGGGSGGNGSPSHESQPHYHHQVPPPHPLPGHAVRTSGNSVFYTTGDGSPTSHSRSGSHSSETGGAQQHRKLEQTRSERAGGVGDGSSVAGGRVTYRNVMSMDDMPELFASFDKLLPKPQSWTVEPPLYLCLRMGRPKNRRIPHSTPVMSYGVRKILPEYWFSVPQSRVEELFSFLRLWTPEVYGEVNERFLAERDMELAEEEILLDGDGSGAAGAEMHEASRSHLGDLKESWEVVSASEDEVQHALYGSNTDDEFIPDLVGESEIFDIKLRKHLIRVIPARCQGYPWKLGFSTSRDGFSLANLYRKMESIDSCVLLVIQDTSHNVFGALLSDAPALNDHFYGTGESFLFTFTEPPAKSEDAADGADASKSPANGNSPSISIQDEGIDAGAVDQASDCGTVEPAVEADSGKEASGEQDQIRVRQKNASGNSDQADVSDDTDKKSEGGNSDQPKSILLPVSNKSSGNHFRVFKWSGENSFFIRCHPDSLAVGAGDGHFGLLLDGDLNHGRTDVCTTFRNDILTENNDFIILTVECWCFD